jgi:hypothetical protein
MTSKTATPDDGHPSSAQERADALRRSAAAASQKSVTFLRPRVYQAWCNLRVWLPFFDTPNRRARQVRYSPNDGRTGLAWEIALPKQCCQCGKTEQLTSRDFNVPVRAFDYPLHIAGVAGLMTGGVLFLAFIAFSFLSFFILFSLLTFAAFIVAIAGGLLWAKSWDEDVRLRLWACPDHVDQLVAPDMVVNDNDLSVVLPSESLADAANAELKERRRGKYRSGAESAAPMPTRSHSGGPPPAIPIDAPPVPRRPVVPDLPPIRLAGDDDDPLP